MHNIDSRPVTGRADFPFMGLCVHLSVWKILVGAVGSEGVNSLTVVMAEPTWLHPEYLKCKFKKKKKKAFLLHKFSKAAKRSMWIDK